MARVEFSQTNVMKCICTECPVQAESACATRKNTAFMTAMDAGAAGVKAGMAGAATESTGDAAMSPGPAGTDWTPTPDEVATLYCASGVAGCADLDFSKVCICRQCPVFSDNALTQLKYCERGDAAAIG
jgi:hypothetical protein